MATKMVKAAPIGAEKATAVVEILQSRLTTYNDLHLTLKHVHWNVVGPNFIAVHEMIDPQVEFVRLAADAAAERMAAMGGSPKGTADALVAAKDWPEYPLNRALVPDHLMALDHVYDRVIGENREAIEALDDLDLVTQDLVIGQTAELEKFQWFVRAHLESAAGNIPS